jgi:hypothetical protein
MVVWYRGGSELMLCGFCLNACCSLIRHSSICSRAANMLKQGPLFLLSPLYLYKCLSFAVCRGSCVEGAT